MSLDPLSGARPAGFAAASRPTAGAASAAAPRPATGMDPAEAARLKDACQQFEALFLQQLLKEARAGAAALSGESRSFDREVYEGWQDEQFAKSMSGSGGIGLAEMLYRQLGGVDALAPSPPGSGRGASPSPGQTTMRGIP